MTIQQCKDIMTTQKAKTKRKSAMNFRSLCILPENSAEGLRSRGEHCWGYVSMYENIPKKITTSSPLKLPQLYFVAQGRAQLELSSHIVKVSVEATC